MKLYDIKPNKEKALFLARRQLPELVCDAVNLEGIHYTIPEIQTLLDGITVGGHKLQDETIALNQVNAWKSLFKLISSEQFEVCKATACDLHAIAGKNEALKWGCFRDGNVSIAGTNHLPPAPCDLDIAWDKLLNDANQISDPFDSAIFIFLGMARNQFFYDVNKRMGRFMMNGALLMQGYPAINLPASRQLEFNQLMLAFYPSGNVRAMTNFMKNCISDITLKIMSE